MAECLYPRVAIVDPQLTVSVPSDQTANGVVDLITHVTESYFNGVDGTPLQDRIAEGVILTAMEYGPRAVRDGRDIQAREQVQWASVVALNGWVQSGCAAPFPVHQIEHVLSAFSDIAHGAGLAVVSPAWMRVALPHRTAKYVQFARRIFGVAARGEDDMDAALEGVERLEAFFRSLGCPTRRATAPNARAAAMMTANCTSTGNSRCSTSSLTSASAAEAVSARSGLMRRGCE